MKPFETLIHRWLKIPYTLHVETNRPGSMRHAPTVLFIHGIGNSGTAWEDVIAQLPPSLHVITIDLLGFGKSPRPAWATYDARTQARAVIATLIRLRLHRPVVITGHSLGALVAVEVTKRYPLLVRSLVLCSPPFYKPEGEARQRDKMLRSLYRLVKRHPVKIMKISTLALRLRLVNRAFRLQQDDIVSYMGALEASIINQTSLEDAAQLKRPVHIIAGRFDPVVVRRNLKELAETTANISLATIAAGHEVQGRFVPVAAKAIIAATKNKRTRTKKVVA